MMGGHGRLVPRGALDGHHLQKRFEHAVGIHRGPEHMKKLVEGNGYEFALLLVTDILAEGSQFIVEGDPARVNRKFTWSISTWVQVGDFIMTVSVRMADRSTRLRDRLLRGRQLDARRAVPQEAGGGSHSGFVEAS